MTDNEKHAHDLAVAMIPIIYDRDYKDKNIRGGDAFVHYLDAYEMFLDDMNESFNK